MSTQCPKCQTENTEDSQFCKKCATPLEADVVHTKTLETPTEELTTGTTFAGRYQIIEELGKGGMGRVYKVLDKETNEKIALKLIKSDIAADKKTVERFRNELTTARKVVQKNVCRMFDLGREKDSYYITMEYISGQDLRDLIRQTGQLTVGKAISIAKQICDGLTEAHSLGVVHRDLKPNNIMIDKGGNAKIMDFGIARAVKGKSITGSGVSIGTPQYMSPEQVEGKDVDQRADIYSLGIILYEMLTDRVPFEGDTPLTIGVKQKTEVPKDPKEFNDRISDELNRLILKCLEKEKESRFQSALDLKGELEKLEQGIPTTERKAALPISQTSKQITVSFTPKKMLLPAAAILVLVIAVLFIWKPWGKKAVITPLDSGLPSIAILNFTNNTGDPTQAHLSTTLPALIIDDLSQSNLLTVQSRERLNQIYSQLDLTETTSFVADNLREIARLAGVKYILTGHYSKFGETYRINVSLLDASTGNLIKSERSEGQEEGSIYSMVDELTRKIKSGMNLTAAQIASDQDKEVGIITTQYPEAYRIYSEGRTLYLQSRFKESIPYMEKAIAIDPDFAMAYRSIATAYSNMGGHPDEVKEYFNKAMEKTDRLALREKLLIQAQYAYYVEQDYKKSLDIWTSFLKEYPEDNVANQGISVIYQERLDLENAIPHLEICRNNRNEFVSTYNNLGNVYSLLGEYEKAREVYREHMEYFGETVNMQVRITNSYAFEGRLDEALLEANKALAMSPLSYNKAGIYFLKGDFAASEAEQRQWIKTIPQQLNTIRWLAIFDFTQGKYQQALKRLNEGLALAKENNQQGYVLGMLHLIGWCHLADGDHETALSCAFEMRDNAIQNDLPGNNALFLEGETQFHLGESEKVRDAAFRMEENLKPGDYDKTPYIGQVLYLNGLADLAEKDYQSAANNLLESNRMRFRENSWYEAHIQSLYHLGEAHLGNGDLQAARDAYEEAINLTTGKMYWGDLWAKSHYKLGEIYEKLGNRTKAIEHTEKFLEMWKDADPGLPEVDDAKKRLAGLR